MVIIQRLRTRNTSCTIYTSLLDLSWSLVGSNKSVLEMLKHDDALPINTALTKTTEQNNEPP